MIKPRAIILGLVIIAIVAGIWYLQKPAAGPTVSLGSGANSAKEFVDPTGFINTDPFTLSSLIGKKVILLDFWTYSCINCQRTIPYLNAWYAKYKDKGLAIVGVHTPEFNFEKDIDNVRAAVKKFGIQYPVVLDSNMGTWNAYQSQYWPNEYLIDLNGNIIDNHAGEGDYDVTERAIQKALNITASLTTPSDVVAVDFNQIQTPELYLGNARNGDALGTGANKITLTGRWTFTDEYAQCMKDCGLHLLYSSRQVNMVAGSSPAAAVSVIQDGKSLSSVTISGQTLYTLINDAQYGAHTLDLKISPGVQVFTLTFG